MSKNNHFQPGDRPRLRSTFLLRWEPSQQAHVLLYPEGIIKLNASAAEILKRCTGELTVGDMVAELQTVFVGAPDLAGSIHDFLGVSHAKGWLDH